MSVPLPVLPALNLTSIDIAYQVFEDEIAMQWKKRHGRFCINTFKIEVLINTIYLALKGLEYEMLEIDIIVTGKKERAATYMSGTEAGLSILPRFGKPLLGGIAAAIALAPVLKTGFCLYLSFFGLRRSRPG